MPGAPIHERIADQFSYRGEGADVWRAFECFLDTDAYLNLGYSPRYVPHVLGSSQRRLAHVVGDGLAGRLAESGDVRLLDVGCGRGGPAEVLAHTYGFDVTGVDLVPYNVEVARRDASRTGIEAEFVVGDAASLPVATDSVGAVASIDALVYVPGASAALEEVARVLRPGGVVAVSDLLVESGVDDTGRDAVDAFAEAWDMSQIVPVEQYLNGVAAAGLAVEAVRDMTPNSVGRFRTWTRLYLTIAGRRPRLVDSALGRWDLDADRITRQVRAAHDALPHLRHVLVYARAE